MPRKTHDNSLDTRKAILASAKRLFSRRGFESTSLSDIAKYAGVTRGAIYWHFENKEELLLALLDSIEEDQSYSKYLKEACAPTESDPLGKLKLWVLGIVEDLDVEFLNSAFVQLIIKILNGSSGNKNLQQRLKDRQEQRNNDLVLALRNAVARGQLPSNLVVQTAAEHLNMFCIGYINQCRDNRADRIMRDFSLFVDWEFETFKRITTNVLSLN